MKLKICGMRDEKNILEVSAIGVDYMGFIFYNGTPRFVGETFAVPEISPSVKRVGVFVNETTDAIEQKVKQHNLDFVQLHGDETVLECERLKSSGIEIIKVFSVDSNFDFHKTKPYHDAVSFFLFDTKGKHRGGNATRFEWKLLEQYDQAIPFFLSGGIGPENIEEAELLTGMNIHAIDVNSGAEIAPAMKDIGKVRALKQFLTTNKLKQD